MFRVVVLKTAQKALDKLPKQAQIKITKRIRSLASNPYIGKQLHGDLEGKMAIRLWPYRIIYKILRKQLIIEILDIGHRQGVYK